MGSSLDGLLQYELRAVRRPGHIGVAQGCYSAVLGRGALMFLFFVLFLLTHSYFVYVVLRAV